MKLLHNTGVPIGITFRRHMSNANSYVIRVTGNGQQTDIGACADNLAECYEKAVDKRLELLNASDNAEAWQTLASAYGAFLSHYRITLKAVTHYEFEVKGE